MPHTSTRRNNNIFSRKIMKYLTYRRAKKLFGEINRDISAVESRIMRQRGIRG